MTTVTEKIHCAIPQSTLEKEAILYKCEPDDWAYLPKVIRTLLGWATVLLFTLSFFTVPICCVLLIPTLWRKIPVISTLCLATAVASMLIPLKEW